MSYSLKPVFVRRGGFVTAILLLAGCCKDGAAGPPVATTIEARSETSVSAVAGTTVSPAPSVIVRDQNGNPFGGAPVTFTVLTGGGTVTGASAVTDSSGIATVGEWTLGATAGPNSLVASSGNLSITFNATGTVGAAARLTVSAGDNQTGVAGSALPIPPAVLVQDANGNPKAGVEVTFAVGAGGGSVTGGAATSNADGIATAGSWTLGRTAGPNALTARSGTVSVNFSATGIAGPTALITVSAGDNQIAAFGTVVPIPPAVRVQDANGNLKSGATVTFSVGEGGGSVTGATATSNAAGIAAVGGWTLGGAASNTLVAASQGAPSVTFRATGVHAACIVRTTHTLGSTTGGALDTSDCPLPDGSFVDFFSTSLPDANAYLFRQSAGFDTYLDLSLADGTVIAENDDATDTDLNSAIKALLPAGTYLLGASSFDAGVTGSYTLSSQVTSAENTNCELVFVVRNVSTTQRIAATDCPWTPAAPIYADGFHILLRAGQSVTIRMSSSEVNSYLELLRLGGAQVAQNDNRDGTTNDAQVTFTAAVTDYYIIVARTAGASQTGAYTLTIQ